MPTAADETGTRMALAKLAAFVEARRFPRAPRLELLSASDRKHSVPEADRRLYARAYAQPGAMRAGFEYFRNLERDAEDFARMGQTRLAMPMLVLSGEKAGGTFLIEQAKMVAVGRPRPDGEGLGSLADGGSPQGRDHCAHRVPRLKVREEVVHRPESGAAPFARGDPGDPS